jgi:hypothetical protein
MFITKKQYLSAKCETKDYLLKMFVFPKVVAKNLCKTGTNTQGSQKKLAVLKILNYFRENIKTPVVFAKIFKKIQINARFLQNKICRCNEILRK